MRAACSATMVLALCLLLAGCDLLDTGPTPEQVRAELLRRMPPGVADREGWARDIQAAFATQDLEPTSTNLCAVVAVIGQESGFRADPPVPGLPRIAREAIDERAASFHVPGFVVDAALRMHAPDGRTYAERLDALRTEGQLSELFEEITARLPLGSGRLFARLNPIHTAGPMQVGIAFAQANARGYPYPLEGSIRHEVFTRRGGVYFGTKHLLAYPARYPGMLYRFADYNAGRHASRNAAFQQAAAIASGIRLARDGDLLRPDAAMDAPGATEAALRRIAPQLGMDAAGIRRDLARGQTAAFADTALYQRVFAIADRKGAGKPVPRARVPDIALSSPKLSRKLTTAWFAQRVDARWKQCMAR